MKYLLIFLIDIYQKVLSPDQGVLSVWFGYRKQTCIFYPTCSEYAKISLSRFGSIKGTILSVRRIGRCNPFNEPGIDLPPEK